MLAMRVGLVWVMAVVQGEESISHRPQAASRLTGMLATTNGGWRQGCRTMEWCEGGEMQTAYGENVLRTSLQCTQYPVPYLAATATAC